MGAQGWLQIALTPDNRNIVDSLGVLPRTLAIGLLGTAIYSAIPLGFSAMAKSRMLAIGGWAIGFYGGRQLVERRGAAPNP